MWHGRRALLTASRIVCRWKRRRFSFAHTTRAFEASHCTCRSLSSVFQVHPEVGEALSAGRPVVALETTIVTHGMPFPDNIRTALSVESVVRGHGVVPATIGIIDGRIHVGLKAAELERLGSPGQSALKVSRRDLAVALSQGLCGGTTVSATMMCAHHVGIPVFITGGIGGVHRGGEQSMDISADLTELGRTPVAVVSAGVKSILDIPRTLEVLETQGVTVIVYGDSKEFPAFFVPRSGSMAECNASTPLECARVIDSNLSFGIGSGILIAVPPPDSTHSFGKEIEMCIEKATREARKQGIGGKAVTPFVLQRVNELTEGKSLQANIALVRHNADVGSQVAVELAKLRETREQGPKSATSSLVSRVRVEEKKEDVAIHRDNQKRPVVVGGSVLDFVAKVTRPHISSEGTNPGTLRPSFGGVARNVAECLARMGSDPLLVSAVGDDRNGRMITSFLGDLGMDLSCVFTLPSVATATYCVLLDSKGEMFCGVGDMDINNKLTVDLVTSLCDRLSEASLVCADANMPSELLRYVCQVCADSNVPVWFEPTCLDKASKPVGAGVMDMLTFVSPNMAELLAINHALTASEPTAPHSLSQMRAHDWSNLLGPLSLHVPHIFLTLGSAGVLYACRESGKGHMYKATSTELCPVNVVNTTGAGDSFAAGVMSFVTQKQPMGLAIQAGLKAAWLSVQSEYAISENVNPGEFTPSAIRALAEIEPQWEIKLF